MEPKGMFEQPLYRPSDVPCPKCRSTHTQADWRDRVWEETGYSCLDCCYEWVKG